MVVKPVFQQVAYLVLDFLKIDTFEVFSSIMWYLRVKR